MEARARHLVSEDWPFWYAAPQMLGPNHPWIDSTHAPVYVMSFPGVTSDEELQAFCRAREDWARRSRHQCAWVVDLREILRIPHAQRQVFAAHLKRFEYHDEKFNRGSALVLSNAWLRTVVSGIFLLSPPKFPNKTFASVDSGLEWARGQMRNR